MKYTRSAAQKSQQQQLQQQQQQQQQQPEKQHKKQESRSTPTHHKQKVKNKKSSGSSSKKSSSKKRSSKYFSDSEDDNDYYDYGYDEEVDVVEDEYEDDEYNYGSYVNSTSGGRRQRGGAAAATTSSKQQKQQQQAALYYEGDDDEELGDDETLDDDDGYTQDSNIKSQASDSDYFFELESVDSASELKLPMCSDDLLIPKENLLDTLSVYETLRHFRNILRLSPFLFEDFCACVATNENNSLFAEVHIALIRSLLKEDEVNLVSYGPTDLKTCIDVSFHLIDAFTWPDVLRNYIECDTKMLAVNANLLTIVTKQAYPMVNTNEKLIILNSLCNMFLSTSVVRNDLLSEGNIVSDDHCRICHKLGNLLCCETCPATYHLDCLDPPLLQVPEEEWICSICKLHQLHGATDCISEVEKTGLLIRQEPLGYDRHRRKYWFLCRRLVVESEAEIWYYSTKLQLDELIRSLDPTKFEAKLIRNINEQYEEMVRCMQITEELTNARKESNKSYFDVENERLRVFIEKRDAGEADTANEGDDNDETLVEVDEKIKVDHSDVDENSSKSSTVEERMDMEGESEFFKIRRPETSTENSLSLEFSESEQLDGVVDNILTSPDSTDTHKLHSYLTSSLNQQNDSNVIRLDLSKEDDEVEDGDSEEQELLPSRLQNGHNTVTPPSTAVNNENSVNDEKLFEKIGINRETLLVPSIKVTDLNCLIPDLAHQKVKIVNDKGVDLSSDASKTITVLNKDSTRYKLAILPNHNNETQYTTQSSNLLSSFKTGTPQFRVINNRLASSPTTTVISSRPVTTVNKVAASNDNMLQDYEFGDSFKFLTNIKPTFAGIDTDAVSSSLSSPQLIGVIKKEERNSKLISSIFENLSKTSDTPSAPAMTIVHTAPCTQVPQGPPPLYKLGMDSNYRLYTNQYSVNMMTMNKHQLNQERDRKNILSRRFLVQQDFNWRGSVFSNLEALAKVISNTIIQIENSIPVAFMHHLWPKYRDKWLRKITSGKNVSDFAKCLLELEASMKPVLFATAWKDSTGFIKLHRETQQEREEHKKEESQFSKRRTLNVSTAIILDETSYPPQQQMAHFTKGLKHQVFKQKGEEYRLTGTGGWYWIHKARRTHPKVDHKKANSAEVKSKLKNLLLERLKDKKSVENILVEEDYLPDAEQPWFNNSVHPYLQVLDVETVDVSENVVTRALYPKETKHKAKFLDLLLEKRQKVFEETRVANELLMKKLEEKIIDAEVADAKQDETEKKDETDAAVVALENMNVDIMNTDDNSSKENLAEEKMSKESIEELRQKIRETVNLKAKVRTVLERSKISSNGEYLVELNNELIRIPIVENNTRFKFKLKNVNMNSQKKKRVSHDAKLPPYTNFMVNNQHTIFAFPYEITRLIARKGGFRIEIPGFKNEHQKQTAYWPYPCNRPLLKTCWCYKTFTAANLASLASQLRYFWVCIRWDALAERPPPNSYQSAIEPVLTMHFEEYMQTTELVKKRSFGLYSLRTEYLVRKKKIPYNRKSNKSGKSSLSNSLNSTPPQARTQPRRSGLRQLRQSVGQFVDSADDSNSGFNETIHSGESYDPVKHSVPIEDWVAEERLLLWQIKSFYDKSKRLEIEEIRRKERILKMPQQQQQPQQQQPTSKLSSFVKSSPQTVGQRLNYNSTINLMNNNSTYKINTNSPVATPTATPTHVSSILATINNQTVRPILNMTKVMPSGITVSSGVNTIQVSNLKFINNNTSVNKTLTLPNGQTVTLIAKPAPIPQTQQQLSQTIKPIIVAANPVKTIANFGNSVKLVPTANNISPAVVIQKPVGVAISTNEHPTPVVEKKTEVVIEAIQQQQQKASPTLNKSTASTTNKALSLLIHPVTPPQPQPETPKQQQQQQQEEQNAEMTNDTSPQDANGRSRRQRKIPAKLNDSYDYTYETLHPKSRGRAKSIQTLLAQKEGSSSDVTTPVKATVSPNVEKTKHVATEEELLTKSEQLLEDIENKAKRKRMELLKKHAEDLKELITYKKSVQEVDVMESIRLGIDLDEYFDLKNRLTPEEFVNKVNAMQNEKEIAQEPPKEQKKKEQQKPSENKTTVKAVIARKDEQMNQNENDNKISVSGKRKSKLRPDTTMSPLSVTKENVQQQQQQELSEDVHREPTQSKLKQQEVEDTDQLNGKGKRKISESVLNTSEGSNSSVGKAKRLKIDQKTYCICNSVYDKKRFYIQCDQCANWYHGECVNITPKMATELDQYKCMKCKEANKLAEEQAKLSEKLKREEEHESQRKRGRRKSLPARNRGGEEREKNLFCLCKKPYDERLFYIGCDKCQDWFHGSCVGILPLEAHLLDTYVCPVCLKKEDKEWNLESKITSKNYEFMKNILYTLKGHKMAWPFLTAVDAVEVPNYYTIIKEPMDLSVIESRLVNLKYTKYIDFMHDVSKIIENCRLFNPPETPFYKCATAIEKIFLEKLNILRQRI